MDKKYLTKCVDLLCLKLNEALGTEVLLEEAKRVEEVIDQQCTTRYPFVDSFLEIHKETPGREHLLVRVLLRIVVTLVVGIFRKYNIFSVYRDEYSHKRHDKRGQRRYRRRLAHRRLLRRAKAHRSSLQQPKSSKITNPTNYA